MSLKMKRQKVSFAIIISLCIIIALAVFAVILYTNLNKKGNDDVSNQQNIEENSTQQKTQNTTQEKVEGFKIDTKYCSLYYPKQWEEKISIKYNEEISYKVEFYGKVEEKEEQHLFNICFNSDDGELLGYFDREEVVNVSIERMEFDFDEDWTQAEMDAIYSMQEESNYVIEMLEKEEGYVIP